MKPGSSRWTDDLIVAIVGYVLLFYYALHVVKAVFVDAVKAAAEAASTVTTSPWQQYSITTTVTTQTSMSWPIMLVKGLEHMYKTPFNVFPTNWRIFPAMLICLAIDAVIVFVVDTMAQTRRADAQGHEHGSAQWNKNKFAYVKEYVAPYDPAKDPYDPNILFSRDIKLNLDNRATGRNLNVLVVGGSGTGKSWRVIKPNIAQANCSILVTDPSGELFFSEAKMLLERGVKVLLFSTSDMVHSNCYNPFDYVYDEEGNVDEVKVSTMISLFLKNADNLSSNKASSGDPFWTKSAKAFISSLVYYLLESPNIEKQDINFTQVLRLTQAGKVSENSDTTQSGLDIIMEEHKTQMAALNKASKAILNYDTFKLAPAKTANSILISAAVDLQLFGDDKVKNLTRTDYDDPDNNIRLDNLGDQQTALFINTPQANSTYNFLVSMLYSQTFDALYTKAEKVYPHRYMLVDEHGDPVITMLKSQKDAEKTLELLSKAEVKEMKNQRGAVKYVVKSGRKILATRPTEASAQKIIDNRKKYTVKKGGQKLPWHLRCLMDEFANIGEIPEFNQKLATMRKYEISCTIVLQAIAQLKAKYKDDYQTIIGNCDTFLFLGSSETETLEYVSKLLGDTTVRTKNVSLNAKGGSESFSATKRPLMTPQEVGSINKGRKANKCIIKIRDVDPFLDNKYDFTRHPNFKLTGDADPKQMIDMDYLDKHYISTPLKKKQKPTKKKSQAATTEAMGKVQVRNLKDVADITEQAGVPDGNINEKFTYTTSITNVKNTANYKGPEATKEELKNEAKTGKNGIQEAVVSGAVQNTGGYLDDSIFQF